MHFEELNATFGKLKDAKLTLTPGLNCIYAPNESGKTTWSRFILNMLYGINTRDRNVLADKSRYQPWNGGAMQGSIQLTADAQHYTLQRTTRRANAPMGSFSCVYTGTAEEVPTFTSANAGELLLGVPREVYERSAFIGQNALAVNQDAELERRIAALITTGEEDTSYSESYERLKKQLNRRKHNHTGQIPVLDSEIAALQQQLETIDSYSIEASRIQQQLEDTSKYMQDLQGQQALWQQIDAQNRYRQSLRQRQEAEAKLQELHDKSTAAQAVLEAHPLHGVGEAELQKGLNPAAPKKPLPNWIPLVGVALCLITSILLYIRDLPLWNGLLCLCGAVPFGILGAVTSVKNRTYRAALAQQAASVAALQQQISEYRLLQQSAQNAAEALGQYRALYDSLPQVQAVPLTELPAPVFGPEEVAAKLADTQTAYFRLRSRFDTVTGQLQSLGNADTIRTQLLQKQEARSDLQNEYEAIVLAMEALSDANITLQNRFSPVLGELAAKIFKEITGGRYEKVLLSRDFAISAEEQGSAVMHSLSLLSQGTADQLYLAVRLAICDMVLPPENRAPLILDDALLSFDETRLHAALDYLVEASKTRQILLFSCQKREQDYLRGRENVALIAL